MVRAVGYAAKSASSKLKPFEFFRKNIGAKEVQIDIKYCGVCHSDVHQARDEWGNTVFPCMPGHEIIGMVTKVGRSVTKFKAGDLVGVGCMVDSCRKCKSCQEGLEQYCEKGALAAMGAEVTAITHTKSKGEDAKAMGASKVLVSTDKKAMKAAESSLDLILSTIPQPHDVNPYTELLKRDGVLTIVGCIAPLTKPLDVSKMIMDRRILATSLIGGIAETQEVLDFCAKHNILPDTKLISIDEVNDAFDALDKGEVDFRYVIDMSTLSGKHESKGLLKSIGILGKEDKTH